MELDETTPQAAASETGIAPTTHPSAPPQAYRSVMHDACTCRTTAPQTCPVWLRFASYGSEVQARTEALRIARLNGDF
jgi:hypothetical protein